MSICSVGTLEHGSLQFEWLLDKLNRLFTLYICETDESVSLDITLL